MSDVECSRELFVSALRLTGRLHNLRATAGCFEGLDYVAAVGGNAALCARSTGAAARITDITGAPLLPQWVRAHCENEQLVESALGADASARERAAGAAMPVDDLTAILLNG